MLTAMPIRWRLTLFHILTVLGIGVLLVLGLFAVFGVAVSEAVEQQAEARSNEAARIVELSGTLSAGNLAILNRDNVMIAALDADGRVVSQIGFGLQPGTRLPVGEWSRTLVRGEGLTDEVRGKLDLWDDRAIYVHSELISHPTSSIASVVAGVSYDWVGENQFAWLTLFFAGFGIVAFILISIGSFFLVRFSLSPVADIASSAAEITAVDLSRRLPVRSKRDELGRLAITFNELLERLEEAFEHREKALAQQRRFVADASHELRTPLTSILGYARMLRSWGLDHPDVAREAVAAMEQKAERMESLVEGLLQLARGDEGAPLALEPCDLRDIVRDAVGQAESSVEREIRLTDALPGEAIPVVVDQRQIHAAIAIVLDNAIKFSPPGGDVMIRLSVRSDAPDEAAIEISDTGPGISEADQERIFERFYRAETSRTTRGTGLGLAIAHETLERHGGSIGVQSAPGEGATFTIRLPVPLPLPVQLRDEGSEMLDAPMGAE